MKGRALHRVQVGGSKYGCIIKDEIMSDEDYSEKIKNKKPKPAKVDKDEFIKDWSEDDESTIFNLAPRTKRSPRASNKESWLIQTPPFVKSEDSENTMN